MEQVKAKVDNYVGKARTELNKYPIFVKMENTTGVDKVYTLAGASVVLLLILFMGFGAGMICDLVGFAYPAYASFKAIESEGTDDDVQWLTYWVVYSCFNILETFIDFFLYWIPLYYAFKMGFLLFLFMPQTQGATIVYNKILSPFLTKHQDTIDKALSSAAKNSSGVVADISSLGKDVVKDVGSVAVKKLMENQMNSSSSTTTPSSTTPEEAKKTE